MSIEAKPKLATQEQQRRAAQFALYMRLLGIAAFVVGVIEIIGSIANNDRTLILTGGVTIALSLAAYIAAVLAQRERLTAGVFTWITGSSIVVCGVPALITGLLPILLATSIINILLAAYFISPRLAWRRMLLPSLVVAVAAAIEFWTPWPRLDLSRSMPLLVVAMLPAAFVFISILVNLLGQSLLQSAESAQEYANLIEQSQATLVERAADLEKLTQDLAKRSEEQNILNKELELAAQKAERRAVQLAASAQVARAVSQVRDQDQLLSQVAQLISGAFGYYHVGIFILDEIGRFAVLRAANSQGGQAMLARNHKLEVGKTGIVGYVTSAGEPRIALDVGDDAVHFDNPDLPDTRSEMALPLKVGKDIIGALDVQSVLEAAFAEEDTAVLSTLADQIAIAIQNARLFEQTQAALQEAEDIQRRYVRQQWADMLPTLSKDSYEYHIGGLPDMHDAPLPEIERALQQGQTVTLKKEEGALAQAAIAVPIKLRDEIVGVIDLHETDVAREWSDEDISFVTTIADQAALALENARLFTQTQQRAQREQLIAQIAAKMRAAPNVEGVLRTAVQEIRRALGASHGIVRLQVEDENEEK